jgi:hypothetical protein
MNSRGLTVLLLTVFGGVVLSLCVWFVRPRSVTVTLASSSTATPRFQIKTWGVRAVLDFRVWSESEDQSLWSVNFGYLPTEPFDYGEVPSRAKQTHPKDGSRPRQIQPGERIAVEVTDQYDTSMAASGSSKYFRFEADSTGNLKELGSSSFIPQPKMP